MRLTLQAIRYHICATGMTLPNSVVVVFLRLVNGYNADIC